MRLTADLINNSLSYINPLKERELDLRGHKIPTIENLGVAKDQECIDFTDNDISILSNFPLSPRLHTLLLARNRVTAIQPTLSKQAPHLSTLVLTSNQISELGDLEPLSGFKKLTSLVLLENPVSSKENYRYWILHLCPQIRFLDFQKVKDAERVRAAELFGSLDEPSELAKRFLSQKSRTTFDNASTGGVGDGVGYENGTGATTGVRRDRVKLSDVEKKRVEELIRNAKSLKEIERLEKMLNEGRVPGGDTEMGGV